MKTIVLYLHGRGGNPQEADHYRPLFHGCTVVGLDYAAQTPWEAGLEFPSLFDTACAGYDKVILIANSIGAFFALHALADKPIHTAFFISPVVDMEALITNMMQWAGVTEEELRSKGEIKTDFGETLSWEYLTYVRSHPIRWNIPTHLLFGEYDTMTAPDAMTAFAARHSADLTVMAGGEHWFHTAEQMAFLDAWIRQHR